MILKKILHILLLSIIIAPGELWAQCSTMGTDFWLSYLYFNNTNGTPTDISVYASGPRSCVVTIQNHHTGYTRTMNVVPNQVASILLTTSEALTAQSGTAEWTGLHITSTDTIALYAALEGVNSLDVTVVLPTISLGTEYRVQSFPSTSSGIFRTSFLVLAADTGTTVVDVTPSAPTLNGFVANVPHTVSLQQGQVFQLRGALSPGGDLTNSTVHVRNNKKVAVFSGHYCAVVPNPDESTSCDYLFDQSLPTNLWGTEFVIPSTRSNHSNHVRVLPLHDNCSIYRNGTFVATRNTGQIYSFSLPTSEDRIYLRTSTPVSVCLFMASEGNDGIGDPSMVSIPPAGQFIKNITFPSHSFRNTMTHYVRVITRASNTGNIFIDGASISSLFLPVPGTSEYVVAHKNVTEGMHTITSTDGDGFSAMIYGTRNRESYATFVGTDMSSHANGRLTINGTEISQIDCCKHDTATVIQAESSIQYDSAVWYMDGVRISSGNSFRLNITDPGCYTLTTHFHFPHSIVCLDSMMIFRNLDICVHDIYEQVVYDTVQASELPVHYAGRTYYDEVNHDTIRKQTVYHCDSTIIYSLHVIHEDSIYETYHDTICIGVPYTGHGFYIEADSIDGTTTHIRRDSLYVYTLHLTRVNHPTLSISYNYVNREYCSLTANTSAPYILWTSMPPDPELTEELSRKRTIQTRPKEGTVYHVHACHDPWGGCCTDDSILIHLKQNFALWVPNVFTPENDINNLFKVIGQEITDFEIYIYYRWGTIAYHSTDINEGWDGTHNGGKCPQGSYAYIIFYKDETTNKNRQVMTGTVTLIR